MPDFSSDVTDIFSSIRSSTGDDELLRIASDYALQLSSVQIRGFMFLYAIGRNTEGDFGRQIIDFADTLLKLLQYNHSDNFVMSALSAISLKRYLNENALRINVQK